MANALFRIHVGTAVDPDGVEAASGKLPPLLGVRPNGAYVTSPPAPYADPALPWSGGDPRTAALVRTFHRAHAEELCRAMGRAGGEPIELLSLRERAQDDLPPEDRAAAIAACAELAARHLRFGKDATTYDTAHEPLCAFVPGTAQYAYTGDEDDVGPDDFEGVRTAAETWCVATTTTTTTSSTTSTLPSGARVEVVTVAPWAWVGATAWTPDRPSAVYHEFRGTSQTFPYETTGNAAAASSAAPPWDGTGSSDGTAVHASDVRFDAAGNLVAVEIAGEVSGHASYATSRVGRDAYTSKASVGLASQIFVRFRVIGGPVSYTVASDVGRSGDFPASTSSYVALAPVGPGDEIVLRDGTREPGQHFDAGVLPPGEYLYHAHLGGGVGFDADAPGAGGAAGAFAATLTLGPAGG